MANSENLKRTEKLQLMLDEEELKAIDDWRFENRMPTRAAAIRELLRRGLISDPHFSDPETEDASTRDFGVVDEKVRATRGDDNS
ncbi:hypothetical protein [Hyphococcus lacteus]|uniref:Ribbon-helix-helix protein, CopG family n=1 Tax=Hyphococcus lacteus TaxID=3143536 RepID=A0ABV3Z3L9_9PROT